MLHIMQQVGVHGTSAAEWPLQPAPPAGAWQGYSFDGHGGVVQILQGGQTGLPGKLSKAPAVADPSMTVWRIDYPDSSYISFLVSAMGRGG